MLNGYRILSCDEEPGYRYRLDVSTLIDGLKHLVVVQLNPSTGNRVRSDPTIGKVSIWAKERRFGRVVFINLFAFRSAHPEDLLGKQYETLVGPKNNHVTEAAIKAADVIVCAWGKVNDGIAEHYHQRLQFIKELIGGREVYSVGGLVAGRFPRHGRSWNTENRVLRACALAF